MLMQRICIVPLVASLLTSCASAAEGCQASHASPRRAQDATFPETIAAQQSALPPELRGAWDLSDSKCRAIDTHESDSRIEIDSRELHGYEHTESLKSVVKVSEAPSAWRIVSISNIAPPEIQGDAVIYVLGGDELTISDGESVSAYVRCRLVEPALFRR